MKDSMYHIVLRTSALTLALLLLFDSGILSSTTAKISQDTQLYLANAVGATAAVEATPLNSYTAELTARDRVLTQREADVAAREIEVELAEQGAAPDYSTYIISLLLFIILVLIVMNYVLDYLRANEQLARLRRTKSAN